MFDVKLKGFLRAGSLILRPLVRKGLTAAMSGFAPDPATWAGGSDGSAAAAGGG